MKRCPQCGRDYNDDSLSFCLDDGSELLFGPRVNDEPATAILPGSESPTRSQIHTTAGEAEPPKGLVYGTEGRSLSAHWAAQPRRGSMMPVGILGVVAAILIGGFFAYRYFASSGNASDKIDSIAVLPFENRSGNAETDYLSDGLTDSLVFRFSQLPNLKVSPTSSVMRYKGKETDLSDIATELGVDAVLSGRLMQLGDNLTISVELVDARTKSLVWKEQYDRKMADLLATQREIATTLTDKIQLGLTGDERGITKKYTDSNEAYQLYLKGRYHWSRRTKDDLLKAIQSYKQAIALDPSFALAYAASAETYNSMGKNPDAPPKDCIPLAKAAALRALELDPALPQAHSALADSLALYDWNWAESEEHFKRSIELDPNISYTRVSYALAQLTASGRPNEVVRELEKAVELEPLSMINNTVLTSGYVYARQFGKALVQARRAFDLDPNFPLGYHWLGFALIANGKYDEAITWSKKNVASGSSSAWMSNVVLAQAYAATGQRGEAEKEIAKLQELGKKRYVRPYYLASIFAALGDKDKAFAELERSFEERDCYLGRAAVDPFMDPLRDDPRFADLMRRMKLTE